MFATIHRSWQLGKQSLQVLKEDTQLVIFPIISAVSCLVVLASFAVPLFVTGVFASIVQSAQNAPHGSSSVQFHMSPAYYAVCFAFYFVNYFVIAFFNSALIACVMKRFDGQPTSVGDGLRMAAARLPQILGWALISATVGMVLKMISERSGLIGKIVIGVIGFAWTIATYFVVPVLVVEGVGPIEAIKRSGSTIRKTWGEALVANAGLGALSFVMFLGAIIPAGIGLTASILTQTIWPAAVGGALTIGALIGVSLVTSTLQMILVAAVYRFAATGQVPGQFDAELLSNAFRQKKSKD